MLTWLLYSINSIVILRQRLLCELQRSTINRLINNVGAIPIEHDLRRTIKGEKMQ